VLGNPSAVLSLVWTDYRLALLFTVFIPLTLLIWSWVSKAEAISLIMTIYWRVASLLAITVYLMIGGYSFSFITALVAKILIPLSLWFWADLNEEIREQPKRSLNLAFNAWRWATTVYCIVGTVIQISFLRCAFSSSLFQGEACQAWLQPSIAFAGVFHANFESGFLGILGIVALILYAAYLGYFLLVKLGRQGRSALNQ